MKKLNEQISKMKSMMGLGESGYSDLEPDVPMVAETDEDIPYAEEVPDDQVPSVNDEIGKVLSEVMDDYAKAKKYIDIEATKLMAGTVLDDIIKNIDMAKQKERELEKANDYYNAREEYYQDKIDTFHEKYGYDNKVIDEISKYSNGLYYLSSDMYDAAQVWYKLWNIAEKLIDEYNENPKRRKTLINIKSNNI